MDDNAKLANAFSKSTKRIMLSLLFCPLLNIIHNPIKHLPLNRQDYKVDITGTR